MEKDGMEKDITMIKLVMKLKKEMEK